MSFGFGGCGDGGENVSFVGRFEEDNYFLILP